MSAVIKMKSIVIFVVWFLLWFCIIDMIHMSKNFRIDSWNPDDYFKFRTPYMNRNLTLVSAFYDINRPDRSATDYLKYMTITLRMPYPLVFFCSEKHKKFVYDQRRDMLDITTIITNDEFPLQYTVPKVQDILSSPEFKEWQNTVPDMNTGDLQFHSPYYIPIQFSKFIWLKRAMKANIYNTQYFYWVDAGIGRFFTKMSREATQYKAPKVFNFLYPGKVTIQYKRIPSLPMSKGIIGSADGSFAGGLFGGWKPTFERLCDMGLEFYFETLLRNKILDNEQIALAQLYHQHPSMFYILYQQKFDDGHCNYYCI